MNFIDRIKSGYREFNKTTNNFSGRNDFLKNGNNKAINSNWSSVNMSDEDFYTGYSYAAINNRANKTAQIAMKYLKTVANEQTTDIYKKRGDILDHPYLKLIRDSIEFSEYDFWYDISTYLDLEGISYILVTRTIQDDRVGNAMEFEVLNPYEVKRIRNSSTLEIGGYTESRNGLIREINPKQIIETRKLNPFSRDNPFAMTDAAKDSQFTLKQAGDYTRHSLKGNQNTPGIISTDVLLDPEQFKNFVNRIQNQEKGSPLFGNGAGAINWNSMQVDLDKAALDKINEISRSTLFAVSGMSKTSMGIEESGTTRDVSKTQTDNLIENHIMPQIQKVIDSFNLDYKKYSPAEYKKDKLTIIIDNPLGKDKEVESKEVTIAKDKINLRQSLIDLGYTSDIASKYANGEIELSELGEPTKKVKKEESQVKLEVDSDVDPNLKQNKDKQTVEDAKAENVYLKELISFLVQKRKDQAKLVTVDNYNKNHDGSGKFSSGPGGSTILDSLNPTSGLLVKYEPEKRAKAKLGGKLTTLDKTMGGKPDDIITIYRGAPSIKKEIVPGDYITDLRELAVSYTGDGNIISKKVRKGDVLDDSSESLGNEYIYRPNADKEFEKKSNNAIQDSLPVINQVNIIEDQQNALKSTINKIQADIIKSVLSRVTQNAFDSQDDIIYASDRKESEDELEKQLTLFYIALFLIYGPQLLNKRKSEFEDVKGTRFILTPQVKSKINDFAKKASKSHIDTILNDLLDTSNIAYDKAVETEVAKILQTITKDDIDKLIKGLDKKQSEKLIEELNKKEAGKEIYELARKRALEGQGRAQIVASIRKEYKDISKTRATTIARTETQRAFNQSQYQADVQFLTDNDLMDRAYKQWKTRSANPCQYCIDLSKEPPIPFDMNFRDMGDELSYIYTKKDGSKVKRSLQVDYEELSAGNAHVNCGCVYILIIKDGNGNFVQSFEINFDEFDKVINVQGYNPYRDSSGRFASGPSASGKLDYGEADGSISSKYLSDKYGKDLYNSSSSKSISNYANLSYTDINSALRRGKGNIVESEFENKSNIKEVSSLDSAMKKISLKDNTVVYRGAANKRNQKFEIGQTFSDPGYSSTSLSNSSAEAFLGDGDNTPYVMKITVPKGTNAIIPGLNKGASKSTAHEVEIVLPRNTKYKINKISTKQDSLGYDYIAMDVEVIK